ncbi:MAG: GPW/gp25 family protein [Planctomycetota bacterium]
MFEAGDAALPGRIEFHARKALERWEPRIDVNEIRARLDGSRMEIDVRRTNREDNIVVPFFLGEMP